MSTLTYTDYPGWGTYAREVAGYRQAVRIDNQIQCSGQGGWLFNATDQTYTFPPTLEAHIDQAFKNVETALKAAGGRGWKTGISSELVSYRTGHGNNEGHEGVL